MQFQTNQVRVKGNTECAYIALPAKARGAMSLFSASYDQEPKFKVKIKCTTDSGERRIAGEFPIRAKKAQCVLSLFAV